MEINNFLIGRLNHPENLGDISLEYFVKHIPKENKVIRESIMKSYPSITDYITIRLLFNKANAGDKYIQHIDTQLREDYWRVQLVIEVPKDKLSDYWEDIVQLKEIIGNDFIRSCTEKGFRTTLSFYIPYICEAQD